MKKLILLLLLFKAFQCEAQSSIKGSIKLKDSVINRTIPFKIEKGALKLEYLVEGYLSGGTLSVKLTDPQGKDVAEFQLDAGRNKGSVNKSSKGTLVHNKDCPLAGLWIMTIAVKNGTGQLSYQIYPQEP